MKIQAVQSITYVWQSEPHTYLRNRVYPRVDNDLATELVLNGIAIPVTDPPSLEKRKPGRPKNVVSR